VPHQRFPLGLVLLEQGVISPQQLQNALASQRQAGIGRIGDWLVRSGAAKDSDILGALAVQQNCPVFSNGEAQDFPETMRFPAVLIQRYGGVPVYFSSPLNTVYLGFAAPVNRSLLRACEHILKCQVEPCVVTEGLHRASRPRRVPAGSSAAETISGRGFMAISLRLTCCFE